MLTQKQLLEEVSKQGHNVTERKVRDWRYKGWLPRLISHGRGRGRGIFRYWEDEVLDQTIALCELRDRRARPRGVRLSLWYMGYQIDIQQVRQEGLRHMERMERLHRKKLRSASGKEEAEDAFDSLSRMLAKSASTYSGLDYRDLQPFATELIGALLNPRYKVDGSEVWELEITAAEYLKENYTFPDGEPVITNDSLVAALKFIHLNVSFNSVRCLLSSVTDRELEVAHRRWRSVIGIIGVLVPRPSAELAEEGRRFAAIFGAVFILALLLLERNRKGRLVDFWIKKIEREAKTQPIRYFDQSPM